MDSRRRTCLQQAGLTRGAQPDAEHAKMQKNEKVQVYK
jgi:hypothetical protein